MESWGFRFEGYKMRCGFISLDQFRFKGRVIEGTQTFDLFLLREVSFVSRVWWGGQGKTDWIERRCLLYSLPLNDEAKSGRRDLNPQPQPWQGYALPLSYFRQRGNIKQRSTTEQFTYHLIRTTSVFPPDHSLDLRSSYEHE